MVPPYSDRISRVPPYSRTCTINTHTGLSPTMAGLSKPFCLDNTGHWPGPRSLATTNGVSVDVLSSGYLDVSVPRVCLIKLCIYLIIPFTDIQNIHTHTRPIQSRLCRLNLCPVPALTPSQPPGEYILGVVGRGCGLVPTTFAHRAKV